MSKVTETVTELVRPTVEEQGLSLWDVEYVREAGTWYLRIYVDKPGGAVSIDDCETLSRALDPILDEKDPIPGSYVFEVGSAGADRVLRRPSDFEQFAGNEVEVSLYSPLNGSKRYVGTLEGLGPNGEVRIAQNGKKLCFDRSAVAQVRLYVRFE